MTEGQAMDAMQALGVLGERKPEPIWDLEADPPVLTDRERLCVWFGECQRADFSLADGYLEFAELSRGVASPDGEPTVEVDGASVTVPRAGAALWRGGDEERAPGLWETVAVGPPGYFRALTGPTGDAVHRLPTTREFVETGSLLSSGATGRRTRWYLCEDLPMCDVDPRGYLLAVRDELNAGGLPPSCCATLRYGEP